MNEESKRKQIKKYFQPFPKWAIWATLIGLVMTIIGANTSGGVIGVGVIVLAIGIITIVLSTQGKPTDNQIDDWFNEDLSSMEAKALNKLGLDKEDLIGETITITGPILWGASGVPQKDLKFKKGKDKYVRFSIYKITLFLITEKQIGTYQCIFNFMKNVTLNDSTDEYFYKDVTSVRTREESSNFTLPNGQKLINSETFSLQVAGNNAIEVVLNDPALEKYTGGSIPTSRAEKSVQTIRTLLREKKS